MKDSFLYQKMYDTLYEQITNGFYPVNTKLPNEDSLREQFNVSLITVKKALAMLAEQGLINRIPGKGTFVTASTVTDKKPKQRLIGVVFEHIATAYGLSMMYQLDRLAEANDYKLIVRFSYCCRERETQEIDFLLNLGVQGLIIMPSHGQHYNPAILKLVLENFPVVLIDQQLSGIKVPSVRTDNTVAMKVLVSYLKKQGCQHIGLITNGESNTTSIVERRDGFYQGTQAEGLQHCPECTLTSHSFPETPELFEQQVRQIYTYLLDQQTQLDAVICSEYSFVPKFVQAARELDLRLNKDLLVCCIDEDDLAPNGFSFTHMKQDEKQIAEKAMELMLNHLELGSIEEKDYLIPALFREREQ